MFDADFFKGVAVGIVVGYFIVLVIKKYRK